MYSEFLAHETTFAACDKNLNNWHQGILWYGFWAVLITEESWLKAIHSAQHHMQNYLLPGYARQAHITLSASGLMAEHHFSAKHLNLQKQELLKNPITAFSIHANQLNSFASAPYLAIEDPSDSLHDLRAQLGRIRADDEPASYHPHITLGLYREQRSSREIVKKLESFQAPPLPELRVIEIVFCRYRTNRLQDPFEVLERIPLK